MVVSPDMFRGKKKTESKIHMIRWQNGLTGSRIPWHNANARFKIHRIKQQNNLQDPRFVGLYYKLSGQDLECTGSFTKMSMHYATSIKIMDIRSCVSRASFHTTINRLQEGEAPNINTVQQKRFFNGRRSTWANGFSPSKIQDPQDAATICLNKLRDPQYPATTVWIRSKVHWILRQNAK